MCHHLKSFSLFSRHRIFLSHFSYFQGHINHYLLEKSRVVRHAVGETNYHIFYYMFAGMTPERLRQYNLDQPHHHRWVGKLNSYRGDFFQEVWNYFFILYHSSRLMAWEILPRGRHWLLNSLRPRQHGRHFADNTFKPVFLYENIRISIKISRKFVSKVQINNVTALVQIMAWRRPGDKTLSEPMMVCLLTHICVTRPQWVNLTEPNPWLLMTLRRKGPRSRQPWYIYWV